MREKKSRFEQAFSFLDIDERQSEKAVGRHASPSVSTRATYFRKPKDSVKAVRAYF